jgi:hypothetical protein
VYLQAEFVRSFNFQNNNNDDGDVHSICILDWKVLFQCIMYFGTQLEGSFL